MKYSVTKKQCEDSIKEGYVCRRCGRRPIPIRTEDNAGTPTYWAGCYHGQDDQKGAFGNFDSGVPSNIYKLARRLTLEDGLYWNARKGDYSDFEYWFQTSMEKNVGMLLDVEALLNRQPRYTKRALKKVHSHYHAKKT